MQNAAKIYLLFKKGLYMNFLDTKEVKLVYTVRIRGLDMLQLSTVNWLKAVGVPEGLICLCLMAAEAGRDTLPRQEEYDVAESELISWCVRNWRIDEVAVLRVLNQEATLEDEQDNNRVV